MRERIAFQTRSEVDDGFGSVTTGPYETVFEEPARLKPGLGSETVIAARLAGTQPYTMTVRSSVRTREITPAWQAVDVRNPSRIFDIKAIANPDEWGGMLNIVVVQQ